MLDPGRGPFDPPQPLTDARHSALGDDEDAYQRRFGGWVYTGRNAGSDRAR